MDKLLKNVRQIIGKGDVPPTVNSDQLRDVLKEYKSDPQDWRQYAHFDPAHYTRNLVDAGNGKYNLMILCWGPKMATSIHDHTNADCFVKVLEGSLLETLYAWPKEKEGEEGEEEGPLVERGSTIYGLDEVTHINDRIGLHRLKNASTMNPAVSLHLYFPPFDHCHVFDPETGRKRRCNVAFYTKYCGHRQTG